MSTGGTCQPGETVGVQAGGRPHFVGGGGAAVERAQGVVGQGTDGRRLVENPRPRPLEVVAQPTLRPGEKFEYTIDIDKTESGRVDFSFTPNSPAKRMTFAFDVRRFEAPPVATVHLPWRVPFGLHGAWIPER